MDLVRNGYGSDFLTITVLIYRVITFYFWNDALKKQVATEKSDHFQLETKIFKYLSSGTIPQPPSDPGIDFGDSDPTRYVFQGRIYPDCSLGLSLHEVSQIAWPNVALYWGNVVFYAKFPSHDPNFNSLDGVVLDPALHNAPFMSDFGGDRPLLNAHKGISTLKIVKE